MENTPGFAYMSQLIALSLGVKGWLNRDPIGEEGGLNLYGFVGNDGVNRWDYLGQEEKKVQKKVDCSSVKVAIRRMGSSLVSAPDKSHWRLVEDRAFPTPFDGAPRQLSVMAGPEFDKLEVDAEQSVARAHIKAYKDKVAKLSFKPDLREPELRMFMKTFGRWGITTSSKPLRIQEIFGRKDVYEGGGAMFRPWRYDSEEGVRCMIEIKITVRTYKKRKDSNYMEKCCEKVYWLKHGEHPKSKKKSK